MEQGLVIHAQCLSSLEILLTSLKGLARSAAKSGKTHIWTSKIGDDLTSIVVKPVQSVQVGGPSMLSILQNHAYQKDVSSSNYLAAFYSMD